MRRQLQGCARKGRARRLVRLPVPLQQVHCRYLESPRAARLRSPVHVRPVLGRSLVERIRLRAPFPTDPWRPRIVEVGRRDGASATPPHGCWHRASQRGVASPPLWRTASAHLLIFVLSKFFGR